MEQHDLLLTSFLEPEQGSPQSQDLYAAQKIWQMMHGCKYVGPKVQKKNSQKHHITVDIIIYHICYKNSYLPREYIE